MRKVLQSSMTRAMAVAVVGFALIAGIIVADLSHGITPPPDPWELAHGITPPPDPWELAHGITPPPDPWEVA